MFYEYYYLYVHYNIFAWRKIIDLIVSPKKKTAQASRDHNCIEIERFVIRRNREQIVIDFCSALMSPWETECVPF